MCKPLMLLHCIQPMPGGCTCNGSYEFARAKLLSDRSTFQLECIGPTLLPGVGNVTNGHLLQKKRSTGCTTCDIKG